MEAKSDFKILGFKKGENGRGIDNIVNMYLATKQSSNVSKAPSLGWTPSVQTVSKDKKYLWNYEIVNYDNGTKEETDPVIIGVFGEDGIAGNGVKDIEEWYAITSEPKEPSSWTHGILEITPVFRYLWNYEVVVYTNGKRVQTDPKIIGVYGQKGEKGDNGTSVKILPSRPGKPNEGDSVLENGDLIVWDGKEWKNVGKIQGPAGENTYIHVAYANSEDGSKDFSTTVATGRSYTGTRVDHVEKDSENFADYKWAKSKGEDGAVVGSNLLNGTDFQKNLDAWNVIRMESIAFKLDVEKIPSGGVFGTDAFRFKNITQEQAFDVLQQGLNGYGDNKILPSRWYTLSFWAKGTSIATYIYEGVVDLNEKRYADGNETESGGNFTWTLALDNGNGNEWTRHTFTFKTVSSFNPSHNNVLFRLLGGAEAYLSAIKMEDGKTATTWCRSEKDKTGFNGKDGHDGKDGVEVGANLLEGTNLVRGNRAWVSFVGDVILNGGMFGTNSIKNIFNGPADVSEMLMQQVTSPDQSENKLQTSTWYTLSFWAKGSRMVTYVYGDSPVADTNVNSIADGVEILTTADARSVWSLDNEWRFHTFTFKTTSKFAVGYCLFRLMRGENAEVSAMKLEEGKNATHWCLSEKDKAGAKMRMTDWQEGRRYLSGDAGEPFYDIVRYKADKDDKGTLYLCVKTVDEDSQIGKNDPTVINREIWEVAQNWRFIATDLLLSERIQAKDIVTEDITVRKLETENPNGGASIKIENGTMKVFGLNKNKPSIEFGMDDKGNAILRYFDQSGNLLYDLGPNQITAIESAGFIPTDLSYIGIFIPENPTVDFLSKLKNPTPKTYYEFHKGKLPSTANENSIWENNSMEGQNPSASKNKMVPNGWYTSDFGAAQTVELYKKPVSPDFFVGVWGSRPDHRYYRRLVFRIQSGLIVGNSYGYIYW